MAKINGKSTGYAPVNPPTSGLPRNNSTYGGPALASPGLRAPPKPILNVAAPRKNRPAGGADEIQR